MSSYIDIVEVNSVVFVQQVIAQIKAGYSVQDSVAGWPTIGLPCNVRLFKDQQPVVRNDLSAVHTVVIEGYELMPWLLDVQDAVLQGFSIADEPKLVDAYKGITLRRSVEEVAQDISAVENVSEELTEPTKAKRGKQSKSKQS